MEGWIKLYRKFIKWIIIANLFAWPVAYYIMGKWLQDFAYRISMSIYPFLIAAGVALLIAIVSVSYQSLKAALANPVDSIKYE